MTEWSVVGVLIAVVGLIAAVAKPMLSLNTSITRLTTLLDSLRQELRNMGDHNAKGHDRLWRKLEQQEETIESHEHRITVLEEHREET